METLSPAQRTFFEQAATQYQQDLAVDTHAQAYLATRGFGQEVAATFRLGVVRRPLVGHEHLSGRLAIPYLTAPLAGAPDSGGVVNFSFRCLKPHDCKTAQVGVGSKGEPLYCPKYLRQEGRGNSLYNVRDTQRPGTKIALIEGEVDAMTTSICGMPAVGLPGSTAWEAWWPRALANFTTIYVVGEGDSAGRKMATRLAREVQARPVRLDAGWDINRIYTEGGGRDAVLGLFEDK